MHGFSYIESTLWGEKHVSSNFETSNIRCLSVAYRCLFQAWFFSRASAKLLTSQAACPCRHFVYDVSISFLGKSNVFFRRASERRVLPIVGVCISSSHLHTFSSSHLLSHLLIFTSSLTPSHLHIFSHTFSSSHLLSHLLIFTPSLTPSHLHIFSHTFSSSHLLSHLLIFTPSHLHIFSHTFSSSHLLSHLLIFTPSLTPSHLHIFSLSHSLSPFSLLSLSFFSLSPSLSFSL